MIRLTNEDFIFKSKIIHGERYYYSLVNYINSSTKVIIECSIHGKFEQRPKDHIKGVGCPKCFGNSKMSIDEFITKGHTKHKKKYDYSLIFELNQNIKLNIICPIHGVFKQNMFPHLRGQGCPKCIESKGEREIREFMDENNIKFIPQYKFKNCKNINPLPFDFYLPKYKICIEYNGEQHYRPVKSWGGEEAFEKVKLRDNIKKEYCENNKIRLIIIKYNENIIEKIEFLK